MQVLHKSSCLVSSLSVHVRLWETTWSCNFVTKGGPCSAVVGSNPHKSAHGKTLATHHSFISSYAASMLLSSRCAHGVQQTAGVLQSGGSINMLLQLSLTAAFGLICSLN
eukprot:1050031-Amphidinium_carterae.2